MSLNCSAIDDIQMPGLTGLEFLNTLERKPAGIFTAA